MLDHCSYNYITPKVVAKNFMQKIKTLSIKLLKLKKPPHNFSTSKQKR
ncbi:hypothetical protein AsAng_0022850 [Aureispira anguillae]|uniref:Uncharacterized protein n=1 Tax=Aureispira anguillae TaxID=2864201 RepID=A0A916DS00_9BACT|nr:hypothetical protein AsAng_0022850 [Aureispira anguillae]